MSNTDPSKEKTYSEQRIINIDKLEVEYNKTLESYLKNYEHYLMNKSRLINDSPKLANKYKYHILEDNQKLLGIIRSLYNNIKNTDYIAITIIYLISALIWFVFSWVASHNCCF